MQYPELIEHYVGLESLHAEGRSYMIVCTYTGKDKKGLQKRLSSITFCGSNEKEATQKMDDFFKKQLDKELNLRKARLKSSLTRKRTTKPEVHAEASDG